MDKSSKTSKVKYTFYMFNIYIKYYYSIFLFKITKKIILWNASNFNLKIKNKRVKLKVDM